MLAQSEKTGDLRVRRTRMLLYKAFNELMAEKSFQSITVQDIAQRAMVNRATFYDHFVDKYALLEYSIHETLKETLHARLPDNFTYSPDHLRRLLLIVCESINQLEHHCMPADKALLPLFETQITTLLNEIVLGWLNARPSSESDGGAPPELAAAVTSWAIYGAALYWNQHGRGQSAERFAAQALPLLMASLNHADSLLVNLH